MDSSIWFMRYTPNKLEDVILPKSIKDRLNNKIKDGKLGNLGFWSAKPGLGKSSTARALLHSLDADALFVNASMDKGIDFLKNTIMNFASSESITDRPKVVVLDEADHITKDAQAGFRGFIDEFSNNCSFIFTGNYKSKMIPALLDRLENYDFESFSVNEMGLPIAQKLLYILQQENVEITDDVKQGVKSIISNCYPCIRSMIQSLQRSVANGKFEYTLESTNFNDVLQAMKSKDYLALVEKVNSLPNPDSMYEFLYNNISMFKNVPQAILFIADGQVKTETVRDKNLNLCATLVNLMNCL